MSSKGWRVAIVAGEQAEKFSVNTTGDEAQVYDIIETGVNVCRFSALLNLRHQTIWQSIFAFHFSVLNQTTWLRSSDLTVQYQQFVRFGCYSIQI